MIVGGGKARGRKWKGEEGREEGRKKKIKRGRRFTGGVTGVFPKATDEVLGFGEEEVAVGGVVQEVHLVEDL